MQGTFSDIIRSSYEWTKTVLLKPFRLKKWTFLCIISLFSAEFSGCNINFGKPKQGLIQYPAWLIPTVIILGIIALAIIFLLLWLHSRFSFIFISSVTRNDASIKAPFRENKLIGNSFFKWNIIFLISTASISLIMILLLIWWLSFLPSSSTIFMAILWGLLLLFIILTIPIIYVVTHDIVLPIMFKERIGIIKGWKEALEIIKREKLNFTKYILIKIGLRIIAGIIGGLFVIAVIFALLIQLGILGGLLYSISLIMPEIIRWGYYVFLIILGIISLLAIIFLVNLILLPIPVFFRTYSLKFLAGVDERYNLFN